MKEQQKMLIAEADRQIDRPLKKCGKANAIIVMLHRQHC
jgi:hypothetical protein